MNRVSDHFLTRPCLSLKQNGAAYPGYDAYIVEHSLEFFRWSQSSPE
jgi:hypothetical protein